MRGLGLGWAAASQQVRAQVIIVTLYNVKCLQQIWHHLYSKYRDVECTNVYYLLREQNKKDEECEGQLQGLLKLKETNSLPLRVVVTFLALLLFLFLFYFGTLMIDIY
jgi:hypothetical protein